MSKRPWASRPSLLWQVDDDVLAKVTATASSLSDILRFIGLNPIGGNQKRLRKRLSLLEIDISHIPTGPNSNRGRKFKKKDFDLQAVMVADSTYNRGHLKRRLIESGLLAEICSICELQPSWIGKPLVLVLDHINGVNNDNRLENLRLLCPNCNSQTDTFAGRNLKIKRKAMATPNPFI